MKPEIFRLYIKLNYPNVFNQLSEEEIDNMGKEFDKYLDSIFTIVDEKQKIIPKTIMEIIMRQEHPLYCKGFSPVFALHFVEFIKKMGNELH